MVQFEFYLSESDFDRLYAIKKIQGKDNLTGNDFAAELLHKAIVNLFPAAPEFDEAGNITNMDNYRGPKKSN